jgi:hypothetical protein
MTMTGPHSDRVHARYSGSGIARNKRCSGMARLARQIGRTFGDMAAAEEGTIVHELIELALQGMDLAREDVRWNRERGESVETVVSYITQLHSEYPDLQIFTEHYVVFPQNVVEQENCGGSGDIFCWSPTARRGWVIDYKNGAGAVAHPSENMQLRFYATAFFWRMSFESVTLVIIQPNWYGETLREHVWLAWEMIGFQAEVEGIIRASEDPNAPLTPGEHCSGCAVGAECKAREEEVMRVLGVDVAMAELDSSMLPAAKELDVGRWAAIRKRAAIVRKFLDDIDNAAYVYAMSGGRVPGEKLVQGRTSRKYIGKPEVTAAGLADITGLPASDFLKTEVMGVTDAEKAVKRAAKAAPNPDDLNKRFDALTIKPPSKSLSLVPVEDPRPEYNAARATFVGVVPPELVKEAS